MNAPHPTLGRPTWRDHLISIDTVHSCKAPDRLTLLALLYVALPNVLFLWGWLKPLFAMAALVLLAASVWQFFLRCDYQVRQPYPWPVLFTVSALALGWSALGGAGHFAHANPDWAVRDTVLGDLVFGQWPPAYSLVDGQYHVLRSAFGYFLPAAALAKLGGIGTVDGLLFVWTVLGVGLFLLLLPLPQRFGWPLLRYLLLVVAFSGMDFLGILLVTGDLPMFPLRLEWWVPFSYTSITGQLYWAPNHALALWLVTALFYRHWGHRSFPQLVTLLLPLLVIWTPFAPAGILPFVGVAVVRWFATGKTLTQWRLTPLQILCALLISYLSLRWMTQDITAIPGAPTAEVAPNKERFVLKYLVFILMEFAVLGLLLARQIQHSRGLFWLAMGLLALLPLYQYGPSNDTMLRLSSPCLILLLITTASVLEQPDDKGFSPAKGWIVAVLLVGACTPFNESWRAATFRIQPGNYGKTLVEEHKGFEPPHYIGKLSRSDLLFLVREPALVPPSQLRLRSYSPR